MSWEAGEHTCLQMHGAHPPGVGASSRATRPTCVLLQSPTVLPTRGPPLRAGQGAPRLRAGGASQGLVGDQGPAGLWIWAVPESQRGVDGLGGIWSGVGGRVWLGGRTEWWDGTGGWVAR